MYVAARAHGLFAGADLVVCAPLEQLIGKTLRQYDPLRKKGAFIENYRKQKMFADGLDEFDSSRECVQQLMDEYRASERPDYLTWAAGSSAGEGADGDPRSGDARDRTVAGHAGGVGAARATGGAGTR